MDKIDRPKGPLFDTATTREDVDMLAGIAKTMYKWGLIDYNTLDKYCDQLTLILFHIDRAQNKI